MSTRCRSIRNVPRLATRSKDAHKGSFGRVLVVGGSVGMAGAPSLVGLAALRSGAGLATIAAPAPVQPTVAAICPCATTSPLPATRTGQLDPAASRRWLQSRGLLNDPAAPGVVVVGPGIGRGPTQFGQKLWKLIDAFRIDAHTPVVVDADALNLARRAARGKPISPADWDKRDHRRTVITPHPGELARMHGVSAKAIQADRQGYAVRTARMMNAHTDPDSPAVVVLKGADTVVTDGQCIYTNRTGNPGMATGGSGDVLAGVIAALIAQGMTCFDAAVAGVHVHGLAGDLAARRLGQISLIATDIIDALPQAFARQNRPAAAARTRPRK